MASSAQDAASAQAKQERKLAKKARKAAREAQEPKLKEAANVDQESAAHGKKEKSKKDRELQKQVLELEKQRHHHLTESKKLEVAVEELLQQAHNAAKVIAWVAKVLKATDDGAAPMPDDDNVSDAVSSGGKKTDIVMKDATDAPKAASDKTDGEKKKKKDKKKSKSKPEEASAVEGQAGDGKRKRQDDSAEQPVSKKGKKAKESKGGEKKTAEEVKIEGLEGGKARQDKFLRLLGGKKAGVSAAKPGSMASKNPGNSVRAEAAIQQQFEAGMALKESGQKRRGLGA
ncbi:hypothetical protein TgHK011_000423 [Trichoderma gracile]|nr:hypothetical protein TgHK011_000423 [Trichoderma gracile]